MLQSDFENKLLELSEEELIELIDSNSIQGEKILAAKRELALRKKIKKSGSSNQLNKKLKVFNPRLFGWELLNLRLVKILGAFLLIILLIVIYREKVLSPIPDNYKSYSENSKALLTDFKTNTVWHQGFDGGSESIINYEIEYKYSIGGKTYINSIKIQPTIRSSYVVNILNQLEPGLDSINIKYDMLDISKSTLNFEKINNVAQQEL